MIILENVAATADFHQQKLIGVQASDVEGELLKNGNFIFVWNNGPFKKMVLTENDGSVIEEGYMRLNQVDESNWKNSAIWMHGSKGFYYISNFKGFTKHANPKPRTKVLAQT